MASSRILDSGAVLSIGGLVGSHQRVGEGFASSR
jgi:hypothetical protein